MTMTWASRILAADVCRSCGRELAAAGSQWCQGCERQMLVAAIDRAARDNSWDKKPHVSFHLNRWPLDAHRELQATKFWNLFIIFAAGVVTLAALWELLTW